MTLPVKGRKATHIEAVLRAWLIRQPLGAVTSLTSDRGLEFVRWNSVVAGTSTHIFFADPGSPGQRGLNENSNGILRRSGLPKTMDFTRIKDSYIRRVAGKRNQVPRKSLDHKTPQETYNTYQARL